MKCLIFVALAVLSVAQAMVLMSPNSLSAAMESNKIEDDPLIKAAMQSEQLYIPMARNVGCSDSGCNAVCKALGYNYGRCVSSSTCQCY